MQKAPHAMNIKQLRPGSVAPPSRVVRHVMCGAAGKNTRRDEGKLHHSYHHVGGEVAFLSKRTAFVINYVAGKQQSYVRYHLKGKEKGHHRSLRLSPYIFLNAWEVDRHREREGERREGKGLEHCPDGRRRVRPPTCFHLFWLSIVVRHRSRPQDQDHV